MGAVVRAHDRAMGRDVAVKLMRDLADPSRVARFQREAEITASLHHPSVLRVHDAGVEGGLPFLVCELVPGARPLDEVLGEVELRRGVELLRDAARGLGHAHQRGVVHRDVKPDNLLVGDDDRLRVADFGLAAARDLERLTLSGALLGTPSHMAPEQLTADRGAVGPPADVWALGGILYQLLTGSPPFVAATLVELMSQVLNAPCPPPHTVAAGVDRRLEAICLRALAPVPASRYPHGDALADDLEAWLEDRPLASDTASSVAWTARWLAPHRRPLQLAIAAALVAAAVTAAGWLIGGRPPTGTASGAQERSPAGVEHARHPPSRPAVRGSPRWVEEGSAAWLAVREQGTLPARRAAAARWLEVYGEGHPGAPSARDELALLRGERPLVRLVHARGGGDSGVAAAILPGDLVLTYGEQGGLQRWRWSPGGAAPAGPEQLLPPHQDVRGVFQLEQLLIAVTRRGDVHGAPDWGLLGEVGSGLVKSVDATPAGEIAVGLIDGQVRLVTIPVGISRRLVKLRDMVQAVAFSSDGRYLLASAGESDDLGGKEAHQVMVWRLAEAGRLEQPQVVLDREHGAVGRAAAWLPGRASLVIGTGAGILERIDLAEGTTTRFETKGEGQPGVHLLRAPAHSGSIRGAVCSADGARLYTISKGSQAWKNELRVWDPRTREELRPVTRLPYRPQTLTLSADGALLAIGSDAGFVELWAAP